MAKRRRRVLIIDENIRAQEYLGLELTDRGYHVITTGSADPGEEIIAGWKPDLILLDPYIGGKYRWDLVTGIRDRNAGTPVLLCLPFRPFENDGSFRQTDDWWVKSFCTSDLIEKDSRP
jgi:DNA-binding response OmpR family regulator